MLWDTVVSSKYIKNTISRPIGGRLKPLKLIEFDVTVHHKLNISLNYHITILCIDSVRTITYMPTKKNSLVLKSMTKV